MRTTRFPGAVWSGVLAAAAFGIWLTASPQGADEKPAKNPSAEKSAQSPTAEKPQEKDPLEDEIPPAIQLRTFMRRKLDASNEILTGLTTDDLEMVKQGARKLRELSTAEKFRVSNDPIYRQFNADFSEITQQLIKAAEEGNADRAAMKWMDATISCLDCHRFVRGMHIAQE